MNRLATLVDLASVAPVRQRNRDDWRLQLPVLTAADVVLREVKGTDAATLVNVLTRPEITRFISAPPDNVDGFARFIAASQAARAAGTGACFAVTVRGSDLPVGIFQVRQVGPVGSGNTFTPMSTAEWGFAIASPFWGTGVFEQAASLVIAFAFDTAGIRRLEARCAVKNGRGRAALRKMGAVPEVVLRKALVCHDELLDQALYAIAEDEWRLNRDLAQATRFALVH
jgi:ribosomal-protein-alanine N-acetyltransferase